MADTPRDLADQAAEAIRSINHMTLDGGGLEYPADVYSVVANLKILAERLPQLFDQLTAWLTAELDAGRVGHDSGKDPVLNVLGIADHLGNASAAARKLYDELNGAHNELSALKGLG